MLAPARRRGAQAGKPPGTEGRMDGCMCVYGCMFVFSFSVYALMDGGMDVCMNTAYELGDDACWHQLGVAALRQENPPGTRRDL